MRSANFTEAEVDDVLNGRRSLLQVARSVIKAARTPRKEKRRQLFDSCRTRSTPPKAQPAGTVAQPSMVADVGILPVQHNGAHTSAMSSSVPK